MQDSQPSLVHLVCGSTGAGKTTYSQKLAEEVGGVLFSIDDWMVSLFGEDAPRDLTPAWFAPRVLRCEDQIWKMTVQLGKQGIPSILDLGFQRYEHRQRITSLIKAQRFSAKLHVLDVDAQVRWTRVQSRNTQQDGTYRMHVSRDMSDYIEGIWERPSAEEIRNLADR